MRQDRGASRPKDAKPDTCTERGHVYPTCISVKVRAQYPGRSGPVLQGYRRREAKGCGAQKSAEGIVGGNTEGLNMEHRE